jgi:hypothetical protein
MLKFFLVSAVSFICLTGCSAPRSSAAVRAPQELSLKQEGPDSFTKDFGAVRAGSIVSHSFTVRNGSNEVLNIKGVDVSCGCTASKALKNTLLPGEETQVNVNFNSKGYLGVVQQFVYVNTDSKIEPVIRFTIKADVVK